MITNENNLILAKSENCMEKLERWNTQANRIYATEKSKFIFLLMGISVITAIGSLAAEDAFSFLLESIVIICLCFVLINNYSKPHKEITEQYNKYELLCRTETLITDTKQIYGRTEHTDVSLLFGDIRDVVHITQPATVSGNNLTFANDIIEIITYDNQKYRFLSFKNANELAEIIKRNIKQ